MADEFSSYYAEYLEGTYDCVDRIVLNAYFVMGQSPGGFRTWWRRLHGSDAELDNNHLMRMAGRFSRRVRAYAQAKKIPLVDCRQGERKHELAEQYLPTDPNFVGVFLILVSRAPAPVWDIQRSKNGTLVNIKRKAPLPYVNHYSFHILDPEWGHVTIKLCGHPPFGAQILLNGHEYVERHSKQANVIFTKEGNCFTTISDARHLAQVADTLCSPNTIGRLHQVCERWIYSACLCFALDLAEQEQSGFHYGYSVYQGEYSRNLLFQRGSQMEQIFHSVIDRTHSQLDVKTIKTIFGSRKRPSRCKKNKEPRLEVAVERPMYNLTIFKLHFGKLTAKCYTKGERVLRIEIIVHNTKALHIGRSLERFPEIVVHLRNILNRFLDALRCLDVVAVSDAHLDQLPTPSQVGQMRLGGIDINKPRMRKVIEAVVALAAAPDGFRASDLTAKVHALAGPSMYTYAARNAAYDLKKLRGKNVVRFRGTSRRYETVPEGLQAVAALVILRDKIIKPVLAGAGKPQLRKKPKIITPVDEHYRTLQTQMFHLFQTIGIAA
jgi:hypothetical protein